MPIAVPPIEILLVEDNPADVRLTFEAFKETQVPARLHVARDGVEALKRLRDAAPGERPDLILLDLNLPRKDGREVLHDLKEDGALRQIPVLVLSTSQAEQDVAQCYRLGANAFVTKPVEIDEFFQMIRSLEQFWLKAVTLTRP
jgi:CheY-like chemotaxis protein